MSSVLLLRQIPAYTVIFLLCIACLPVFAQEVSVEVEDVEKMKITADTAVIKTHLNIWNGGLLIRGTVGSTPVSGSGTRLMWIPGKAAFRAGAVTGPQWDNGNIGSNSFVAGGLSNRASGSSSFAGGGSGHAASGADSFIGGGWQNTASHASSFVGGGDQNTAGGDFSFIGGGVQNKTLHNTTFVGGGSQNTASGSASFVGGGARDTASGSFSFIAAGIDNRASGNFSFIGGGGLNIASNFSSCIAGGEFNTASGIRAFIGGGQSNTASGLESFVGSGKNNTASSFTAFVGGGHQNTASGMMSFIGGGWNNIVSGEQAFIGGGEFNTASGLLSFIGGGAENATSRAGCFIGGGTNNSASGSRAFTGGGQWLLSQSFAQATFGRYNADLGGNPTQWIDDDALFVIGNGENTADRANAVTVLKNGRVGLQSTVNPEYALDIPNDPDIGIGSARASAWLLHSDRRVKSEVEPLRYGLEEVLRIEPVQYLHHSSVWTEEGLVLKEGSPSFGVLAQDLYLVIPEIVSKPGDEGTSLWAVDYARLTPVLVKAVQELDEENRRKDDRIRSLEAIVCELRDQTAHLAAQIEMIVSQQKRDME